MSMLVRVTLRYGPGFAEILSCVPIAGPEPTGFFDVSDRTEGAWIDVVAADGTTVYRQVLPDPHVGREIFGGAKVSRMKEQALEHFATVEVPRPGSGSKIEVHMRRSRGAKTGMAPSDSRVASFALRPEPPAVAFAVDALPVTTKRPIWGHTNPNALTLVFFAEGFTAAETPAFHQAVDKCVEAFEATVPFKNLLLNLAVAEVETVSRTSGIAGTSPGDTVFKAHFQVGSLNRVILADQQRAAEMLNQLFRVPAQALIVANTTTYGGSGGAATVFSCEPLWSAQIAMHELGHSHFGLADEYDAAGQAQTMDPVEANVCGSSDRARLKWADLVATTTPLPTPMPLDARGASPVGAYEGAKYRPRGVFRPAPDCKMRTTGAPYCAVCSREIERRMARHAPA